MIRTAWPDEPRVHDTISPAQFPGLGADAAEPIDWYALNAYAELVGWRCRFLPFAWRYGARIMHPEHEDFELAASLSYAVDPRRRTATGELERVHRDIALDEALDRLNRRGRER